MIVDTSHTGKKHECKQNNVKDLFFQNPTPACIEIDKDYKEVQEIPIQSSTATNALASVSFVDQHIPTTANLPAKFYSQLLKTLKTIKQDAPQQQKNVVESHEHEEYVDLAKLQTSMLKLFYVNGVINWREGTVKDIHLATFAKGFLNLSTKQQQCRRHHLPICSTPFSERNQTIMMTSLQTPLKD
jgi:hypothetical protein